MTEWRRFTGTPRAQLIFTAGSGVLLLAAIATLAPDFGVLPVVAAVVTAWLLGLVGFGLREYLQWNRLVENSEFERQRGPRENDLHKIIGGHSVTVTTDLDSPVGQTHAWVSAPVNDVDATFTVRFSTEDDRGGVRTGNEDIDARYSIQGSRENVDRLLTPDVQMALMDAATPGTVTVSGDRVTYEIPFTQLTPAELSAATDVVVTLVDRVEALAQPA
jgi:hypothetical protein